MGAFSLPITDPNARARNPILDEIDAAATNAHAQLSPQAQEALKRAGAPLPQQQQAQPQPITPPKAAPAPITPVPQSAEEQANVAELNRITGPGPQSGSGISQMKHAGARIPLQILDAIGSGLFPRIAAGIPGTQAHHDVLVAQREGAVKQGEELRKGEEQAQLNAAQQQQQLASAENLQSEAELLHPAQAAHLEAQAYTLLNPEEKGAAKTISTDQGIMQWNPETRRYDIQAGGLPEKQQGGSVHQDDEGNFFIAYPDGSAKRVTIEGTPVKGKSPATSESTDVKNYEYAKQQGYKGSFEQWQVDEANRKQPKPGVEPGTWTLQEDDTGKPILFNSKTGQTRPAPQNLQPRGTAAKDQPVKDALAYAENYMKGGNFTGPGDLALMDQFYQAAKPKRMNEKQNQLLLESQSFIESAKQGIMRKFSPNAPYFDDTQRQNIVQTMRDLAKSQTKETGGGSSQQAVRVQQNSKGKFRYSTDGGKTWQNGKPPQQ